MAEVIAQLNKLRMAPRKVRAVANLLKGKGVVEALDQAEFMIKRSSGSLSKLINSAVTNAETTFGMVKDNLYIKKLIVDEGTKLKRFRAKGFGRAAMIQKKTSHIKLVLDEKVPGLKRGKVKAQEAKEKDAVEPIKKEINVGPDKKPEIKREIGKERGMLGNLTKKFFRRKSI